MLPFCHAHYRAKPERQKCSQDNHIGLQILDTAGNEAYACQKPGNAQDTYSNADLLQLNQTGHLDTEDMTSFAGIVTECGKEYVYILHFPVNIQKVTMYLNGERFTGGKKIVFSTIGILLAVIISLGLAKKKSRRKADIFSCLFYSGGFDTHRPFRRCRVRYGETRHPYRARRRESQYPSRSV